MSLTKHMKGQNAIGGMIGVMVLILIGVVAVLPVVNSAIADANFTGTTKTIVSVLPIMLVIAMLMAVVYMAFGSGRQ